jgi:predicted dehydrogenase
MNQRNQEAIDLMTRRGFGLTAASMMFSSAKVLSAEEKRLRAAMVGTGHGHAASKARVLSSLPQFDFAGVCRPDPKDPMHGDAFATVRWLQLEDILNDATIDVVAIEGADPQWNLDHAWRAVRAGKHVHLDKPPGADFAGFQDLLAEAVRRGLQVQMGYQWRYHPGMRRLLEAARNGWLGEVYRFRAIIDKPILADERQHLARYKGGMMFSEGCHLIDLATAVLGEPARATGLLRHHHRTLDDGLIDNAVALLEYPHAIAEVHMAGFDPNGNQHRTVEVFGTNGLARVQPFSPLRLQVKLHKAAGPYAAGDHLYESLDAEGYPYAADFLELFRTLRHAQKPSFPASHDLFTHRVLLEVCGML